MCNVYAMRRTVGPDIREVQKLFLSWPKEILDAKNQLKIQAILFYGRLY